MEELNIDRKYIAKTLANLLGNESYRKVLEQEKNASGNREEILDASVFLNKSFTIKDKRTKFISEMSQISAMHKASADVEKSVSRIKKLHKGYVDIYFPIDEHRANWKSSSNELYVVVYDRKDIDNDKGFLTAFDLNGNEFLLDVSKKPMVPTLAVALSETHGKYPLEESTQGFFNNLQKSGAITSLSSETQTYECYLKIGDWFCRDAVGDGFWDDPEYYTSVRHPNPTSPYQRTNFYEVVDGGHGYYGLNRKVFTYPYAGPYLNPDNVTHIEVWEDDGGWAGGDDPIEVNWRLDDYLGYGWNDIQFFNGYHQWWGDAQDQWITIGWFYPAN